MYTQVYLTKKYDSGQIFMNVFVFPSSRIHDTKIKLIFERRARLNLNVTCLRNFYMTVWVAPYWAFLLKSLKYNRILKFTYRMFVSVIGGNKTVFLL